MLALGLEILVTAGGVTGGVAIVVVVEVVVLLVGVVDELVGVVGFVGVEGVVGVVVGDEVPDSCPDLRDAEMFAEFLAAMGVRLTRGVSTPPEALLATVELPCSVRNVVPGALADTGSATTTKVKTLRTNASNPPKAARRERSCEIVGRAVV
jgi:hypothetical protein